MQTKTCGECIHWEDEFEGVKIGCLHLGKGARFSEDTPAGTPACEHFEDPHDPKTRACATCRNLRRRGGYASTPARCTDDLKKKGKHSPAHCKRWKSKPTARQEVLHA